MTDKEVSASLQSAARELARRFPDRAFALFVIGATEGDRTSYVSNAPREKVLRVMKELTGTGLPGIPPQDTERS